MLLELVSRWVRPALALSATVVCGCPSDEQADPHGGTQVIPEPSAPSGAGAPAPGTRALELLSEPGLQLGFNEKAMLRVRLRDEHGEVIAGGPVSFALAGRSHDSSLENVEAITDADGVVENQLISGEMAAVFSVRITAPGADALFVEVSVSNDGFGTLQVQAGYDGPRTVLQSSIFAQAGVNCADAARMPGDPMVTLGPDEDVARFVALPAEVSYAILAFAEGKDGTVVATGCTDAVEVPRDDQTTAIVHFEDKPLEPLGSFALRADLDASKPALALGSALSAGATTLVNTDSLGASVSERAEARFLLDSLDSTLRSENYAEEPGAIALADAIAEERATPSLPQSPEQSLDAQLSVNEEGALRALPRLVQLTIDDLEQLRLFVELNVALDDGELPIYWRAVRIEALPKDSGRAPVAIELASSDPVLAQASLNAEQDALEFASVRFALPFGMLAAQVLREVVSFDAAGHGEEMRALVGCASLAQWLTSQSYTQGGACGESCVNATCDRAVTRLVSAAESALHALDEARPTFELWGALELSDDDGDLIAEHMSAERMFGEWEPETGEWGDILFGLVTASTLQPAAAQR
jgi:hypothetical protein